MYHFPYSQNEITGLVLSVLQMKLRCST